MTKQKKALSLILVTVLMLSLPVQAERPAPSQTQLFANLYEQVGTLIKRYYPEATSDLLKDRIHFEYNTRVFVIHEPLKTGEWQDPREERGPNKGGILVEILLRPGRYEGAAMAPQTFDKRYFKVLLLAPFSRKCDCHLHVRLYYPGDAKGEFLKEFQQLIDGFGKVTQSGG